jgi:hypothetical protein
VKMYELFTIMRQKHQAFAELLNRVRVGAQTEADIDKLKSYKRPPKSDQTPHICCTHSVKDYINELDFKALLP